MYAKYSCSNTPLIITTFDSPFLITFRFLRIATSKELLSKPTFQVGLPSYFVVNGFQAED